MLRCKDKVVVVVSYSAHKLRDSNELSKTSSFRPARIITIVSPERSGNGVPWRCGAIIITRSGSRKHLEPIYFYCTSSECRSRSRRAGSGR